MSIYITICILNYRHSSFWTRQNYNFFPLRHWNSRTIANSYLCYILYKHYFDTTATLLNLYNSLEPNGSRCMLRYERKRAPYIPSSIASRPANYFHLGTARSSQCLHITPRTEWPTDVIKAPHEERTIFPHNSSSDHDRDWHNLNSIFIHSLRALIFTNEKMLSKFILDSWVIFDSILARDYICEF